MTIGDRIKKRRDELNFSQIELAEKIGVSKQTLYKYENNIIMNIPSDKIENLSVSLETTPAYLMGWEDNLFDWEIKERISQNIGFYRKKLGLMQVDLAEKIGVRVTSVSAWERGDSLPNIERLYQLCKSLNITPNEIYGIQETDLNFTDLESIACDNQEDWTEEEILKIQEYKKLLLAARPK